MASWTGKGLEVGDVGPESPSGSRESVGCVGFEGVSTEGTLLDGSMIRQGWEGVKPSAGFFIFPGLIFDLGFQTNLLWSWDDK